MSQRDVVQSVPPAAAHALVGGAASGTDTTTSADTTSDVDASPGGACPSCGLAITPPQPAKQIATTHLLTSRL
jgi:hypothetical protein